MTLKLNIIICSTRPGRIGAPIACWFDEFARANSDFSCQLVDLVDFDLPVYNEAKHPRTGIYEYEHTKKWSLSVDSADAYVFVLPEYNFCPPPSFVNALNYLHDEWGYKPCGFLSYGGASGGLRSAALARQLVTTLKMMPMMESISIPMAWNLLSDNKVFQSNEAIDRAGKVMLAELNKWAVALRSLR